ncbi:LCP family protein [Pseudonocardia nantongensis]|uniref:LCP family protein n=1 Tax=Pseudonocardia nantongensis TaxID=1181885 RepID=UPI003978472C
MAGAGAAGAAAATGRAAGAPPAGAGAGTGRLGARRPGTADPDAPGEGPRPPGGREHPAAPTEVAPAAGSGTPGRKRPLDTARSSLAAALGLTAASTVLPGSGHLALRRRRTGGLIIGTLLAIVVGLAVLVLLTRRSTLLQNLLSTTTLTVIAGVLVLGGIGWIAQIARTYALARPRGMPLGRRILGTGTAALMCLTVAVPFGFGVELLNSQRGLLNSLFQGGGTSAAEALGKPRLNVLLLGSDAGDDRTGTRTDTMMVASIDTVSGRTTLFSLPRNIQRAEFPPGSPASEEFPSGFNDPSGSSGDYLLNAVYAYGQRNPQVAPQGPTPDPGLNLLQSTISYMTGLPLDYYLEVNMAGFTSMIDAVGGVTVNVGPEPIPVGGVTAGGTYVKPDYYIQPGMQTLNGTDALWFARSRRNGTDYQRMGRQRCLIQSVVAETSATELITRFQQIAAVTRDHVATDMPQQVLPALAVLADEGFRLESVAFDPSLPDPNTSSGTFDTSDPDVPYMQEVVRSAIAEPPPPPDPALAAPPPAAPTPSDSASPDSSGSSGSGSSESSESSESSGSPSAGAEPPATSAAPQSVADSCGGTGGAGAPAVDQSPGTSDSGGSSSGGGFSGGSGTTANGLGPAAELRRESD